MAELGRIFGVSRERIRQIVKRHLHVHHQLTFIDALADIWGGNV
jgi:hypothetical protein